MQVMRFLVHLGCSDDVAIPRQTTVREDMFGNVFRVLLRRLHPHPSGTACTRRPVQRTALRARARSIVASAHAERAAKNDAFGLRRLCEEVRRKKGAATRG